MDDYVDDYVNDILLEQVRARQAHGPFHSAHEGFAVLNEEVDELWEEVRKKSTHRTIENRVAIYNEAKQIAAMALRMMMEVGVRP